MSEENVQNTPEQKPEDIFAQRAAKVQDLAAAGILPFGRRFDNVQMTGRTSNRKRKSRRKSRSQAA